jgi:hypothetical protein
LGRLRARFRSGLSAAFPDSLFQLGGFADLCDLFACYHEFVSLFGRTGNFIRKPLKRKELRRALTGHFAKLR